MASALFTGAEAAVTAGGEQGEMCAGTVRLGKKSFDADGKGIRIISPSSFGGRFKSGNLISKLQTS